jgi:Tol biopolymer transport system component
VTETGVPASQFPLGVVYTIGAGNGLWLVGADGQTQLLSEQQYPTLSPDQQQILYSISYDGEIWLSDLATGESRNLTNTPDRIEESFQWWPANPGVIVFSSRPADNLGDYLATINVDGTDYRVLDEEIGSISPGAPSPDGQMIAFDRGGEPWLYRLDGGLEPIDFSAFGLASGKAGFPEWSPDGKMLAWKVYSQDGTSGVAVLDLVQGKGVLLHPYTILGGSEMFAELAWSPDGQWLAVANQAEIAGERVSLWAVRVDGSQEHYLGGRASSPAWSPDSRYLVYSQLPSNDSAFDASQTMLVEVGDWQPSVQDLPGGAQVEDWVILQP